MGFDGASPFPPDSPMERFFRRFGHARQARFPTTQRPQPRGRMVTGQGSGFFISADGYAVTNNHVVDKAAIVEITTDDGKTYTAKVIGTDPRTDVALLKAEGRNDFPFVKLGDKPPRIGDWVLAVGNPFGLGGTVTAGIVSARGRDIGAGPYDDFIQIDAPVNKGNSGGPTFDVDGNVIGVNTAIFSPSGGSVGIAFAIPAETVKTVVAQLKDKGSVTRGWIGVQIQPVTAEIAESLGLKTPQGALVAEPQSGGPAAEGRHPRRRRDHRGQRQPGQGRARPRQADRRAGARTHGQADRVAQGRGEDLLADARRVAEAARGRAAKPDSRKLRRQCRGDRGSASRLLPPARSPAADPTAWSSPRSIPTGLLGARLQDRRRHPGGGRQESRRPSRRARRAPRRPEGRQAHGADAGEVGRRDQVRRRSARPRLTEWDVPPASVAPAGGSNQGGGPSARPHRSTPTGIRRPRRDGVGSRGRWTSAAAPSHL